VARCTEHDLSADDLAQMHESMLEQSYWCTGSLETPCLIFWGGRWSNGYGRIHKRAKGWRIHRIAFIIATGMVPEHLICHRCDEPLYWNVEHLFEGTNADNNRDMIEKGRRGAGNTELTEADFIRIRELLADGLSHTEISKRFRVSQPSISNIARRSTWRHFEPEEAA
jgi:hypothetical protein